MTFREMNFSDNYIPGDIEREEASIWSILLNNQGPILKLWFGMMLLYLIAFIIL